MKLNVLTILAVTSVFLVGCQSNDGQSKTTDSGYRCEQVTALGSNIPTKYCSTRKQRDETRRRGAESLRNSQKQILTGNDGR
ncbi:hypothetical protein N473_25700 [Pseudoalteromonas luteoviolacea CPMOR-1]|uniref:Lipoprotein n=1 Tax=Pseudoalteromonas luteoviolacea CPMOR-1 TaxID=1365248 RepID=A0A161YG69_9GAMM|nr:hypothetical protein [Pseudoalteromonas luteoviolacea]KZN59531.1 hypothetical protein N473_25700 [Pseudoalteromonas luteoviolacea CPMOR-1]